MSEISLLICSCDKYEDVWELCAKSIDLYWPKCPYKKILLTESKMIPEKCEIDDVINTKSTGWSDMLHEALSRTDSDFVVFMLEDQWPVSEVNQEAIDLAYSYMIENPEVAIMYFEPSRENGVKKSKPVDDNYNEIPFGAPYRLSCAPGIFRRDFLYNMTSESISPWDFERIKSFDEIGRNVRVLELKNCNWNRIDETGAVFRGKWVPGVKEYAEGVGVELDFTVRGEQTKKEVLKRKAKDFVFNLNPDFIVKMQHRLKK